MRVRPFFWLLLFLSCISVLTFAVLYQPHVPAHLQVHVDQQQFVAETPASLELHITDPQGLPIDQAEVTPSARMTNMDMAALHSHVTPLGNGTYKIKISLFMAGPWVITVHAHVAGFEPQQSTLYVQVV